MLLGVLNGPSIFVSKTQKPGTPNNHFIMDVWVISNRFSYKDLGIIQLKQPIKTDKKRMARVPGISLLYHQLIPRSHKDKDGVFVRLLRPLTSLYVDA